MSTNYYSMSEQDRKKRLALWEQAPKQCPYCETPINTDMPAYGNDKPRHHCGSGKCRKAASRANIAQRKEQARTDARARVLRYCEQHVDQEQKQAIMEMCDVLMEYSHDEGHQIAEHIVAVIESRRCKHDRIEVLEQNAVVWKRRGEASERQLKERITELEAELALFNNLEATYMASLHANYISSRTQRSNRLRQRQRLTASRMKMRKKTTPTRTTNSVKRELLL